MNTVHLIVGPERHGVCRHAERVAAALGDEVVRVESPTQFDLAAVVGVDVVHIPYTDQLFGKRCEESAAAFVQMVQPIVSWGIAISVTLHDLPFEDDDRDERRRVAYRSVVACARGVVVNSQRELGLLDDIDGTQRSRRQIPLPVETFAPAEARPGSYIAVLGFIFPDRGYEHTIDELPTGSKLVALGAPATGHEDLPPILRERAAQHDCEMVTTGFVADEDLSFELARTGVPIAPNRRVAASASISTWIGHGRRPLVPATDYTRELAREWPGTVTLYDAEEPGALREAINAALKDPSLTFLAPNTVPGPSVNEVARQYRSHFATTAAEKAVAVGSKWAVPDNRWDLLNSIPSRLAKVSVVIPYFEAQSQLDRVFDALSKQTYPKSLMQMVVADDGSSVPPSLSAADLDVVIVRQEDKGFRAAAARNLGAAAADGEVLLFLDGDTYPEPDYVERLSRMPSLAPDVLAVGRRRHADFSQDPPLDLGEPEWLVDAYAASTNLLHADERSYRYVISAVMGIHRDLFEEIDGFDESFTSYGGEDWDLAHRAYVAGAVFAHVRNAVAWHDGPEWAERSEADDKNAETFALARLIPDTVLRGGGQWLPYPSVVIRLDTNDSSAALATVRSAFVSNADCGFWIENQSVVDAIGDPRVHFGPVPTDVAARALVFADLVPADLLQLPQLVKRALDVGCVQAPAGTFRASRAERRDARWRLQHSLFGFHQYAWPRPFGSVDLHHQLKKVHERRLE